MWELTNNFIYLDILRDKQENGEQYIPSYSEIFVKKYLRNLRGLYQFYSSIFHNITKGFLDVDKFVKEFTPSPYKNHIDSLYKLNDYLTLSDSEIEENIAIVLDGLDKGIYNIYTHQSIFQKLFDLSTIDITKLSVDEIKIKIFLSLDKAKLRTDDFDEESFDRGDFYITDSDVAREVFSKIKELHGEHFLNKKKSLVLSILSKLDKEKANYSEIIHSFILVNLSEFFTFKELLDKIFAASNYSTTKFFRFMEEKYRYDDYKTTKDISFIEMLKKGIESKIANDKLTPVKKSVLIAGLRMLGNIHKEFEKREPK